MAKSTKQNLQIVRDLIKYRDQVRIDADGADDRIYLSDEQWDAIEDILIELETEYDY